MSVTRPPGILGLGVALPETVRTNAFWPGEYASRFADRAPQDVTTPEVLLSRARTETQRIQLQEMLETYHDPFRGSRERRVASDSETTVGLEVAASQEALQRAGVDPADVDVIFEFAMPGDCYVSTNAGGLQHGLGARRAQSITLDTGCSSFLSAAALADSLVRAGAARHVLVASAAIFSRLLDYHDPLSVNFGDGAGAAVIGRVASGGGFLAHAARTIGELTDGVCVGPKAEGRWYEVGGPMRLHSKNLQAGREIVMRSADYALEGVNEVLRAANLEKSDVNRFYSHQPSAFFNAACRKGSGLGHAETTDTFARFGSLGGANIPVNLYFAQQSGQLKAGDVAVLYACGAGLHWTASVLRWTI